MESLKKYKSSVLDIPSVTCSILHLKLINVDKSVSRDHKWTQRYHLEDATTQCVSNEWVSTKDQQIWNKYVN